MRVCQSTSLFWGQGWQADIAPCESERLAGRTGSFPLIEKSANGIAVGEFPVVGVGQELGVE